eukprot:TRINITY_DN6393_c0_g1_i1.p2 TRINITY_DN6393_c0_g1~~TRINITY_DN6393_c0_g1_i1.p2  ORF type:complete len:121 (-),score=23.73 TRINITY_DN6393_c0_g1_i1:174-536(-)
MVIVVDIAKETPLGDSSSSFHSLVALRGVKLLQPEILSRYIRKLFHCKKSSVSASSPSALHSVIPQNPVTECWLRCPLEEGKDLNCIPSPFSLCLDRIASYPISLKGENPMKKKWGIPQN